MSNPFTGECSPLLVSESTQYVASGFTRFFARRSIPREASALVTWYTLSRRALAMVPVPQPMSRMERQSARTSLKAGTDKYKANFCTENGKYARKWGRLRQTGVRIHPDLTLLARLICLLTNLADGHAALNVPDFVQCESLRLCRF